MIDLAKLLEPFPKDAVSWRAQHFTSDGTSALALAYIDARDVFNRLDDVCGQHGWSNEISETAKGRIICRLGINIEDKWIYKSDGAGDTDVESEKGAISDAIKRAGVLWGIGRYLYDLDAVWVPCKAEQRNGKWVFKGWSVDPWTKVKLDQRAGFETAKKQNAKWEAIADELRSVEDEKELGAVWGKYKPELTVFKRGDPEIFNQLEDIKNNMKADLLQKAGMSQGFNDINKGAAHV